MSDSLPLSAQMQRLASAIVMRGDVLAIEDSRLAAICAELKATPPPDPVAFVDEVFALMAKAIRLADEGKWERLATQLLAVAVLVGGEKLAHQAAQDADVAPQVARAFLAQPPSAVPASAKDAPKPNLLDVLTNNRKG